MKPIISYNEVKTVRYRLREDRKDMRKKIAQILSVIVLITLITSVPAYAKKTFMWEVRSQTTTVYVLGSIHFMKKEFYPLNKKIEDAFDKSTFLAVEANVDDVSKLDIEGLIEKAFYTADDTLQKHVSVQTYERVRKEFESSGIPAWLIDKQKPWFLALTLESLELVKLGFDPAYGIDVHFLSEASGKKKIKELESIDYQINLLSGFSDSEQEAFLLSTLKDLNSYQKEADKLLDTWASGDTAGMESILQRSVIEDKGMASVYDKLLYDRNRNMVSKIEDYLKTGENHFVVVGAAHLLGEKGVINLLRQKGYRIEQM
jgi:uncharacterized protein YbaP (TraB family)